MSQDLLKQLAEANHNVNVLSLQLEAHRQTINEMNVAQLNLRTNLLSFQRAHQDKDLQLQQVVKERDELKAKVAELEKPVNVSEDGA